MTQPSVVARGSLAGLRVGLSVSESADLAALGLTSRHCELAVAELTRALILAGATVVYGGRLRPEGFTQILLDEAQRFADGGVRVEIVLAETEFQKLTIEELDRADSRIAGFGELRYVRMDGSLVTLRDLQRPEAHDEVAEAAEALSAMRWFVASSTSAQVLIGGRLVDYQGTLPGVIEEASLGVYLDHPIYAAAGFGGAAAAVASRITGRPFEWAPKNFPAGINSPQIEQALLELGPISSSERQDGLTWEDRQTLQNSHRPADIASVVIRALSRRFGGATSLSQKPDLLTS